jgi:CheY-like chemotaxis protein
MTTLTGLSVLLLEDEYLIALDAEQILRSLGVGNVEIVGSYADGQERAQSADFDVAVLDVNINGQFSFPIADTIRARGIPFVFASGYELRAREEPGLGNAPCVTKPYTSDRLKTALMAALAGNEAKN